MSINIVAEGQGLDVNEMIAADETISQGDLVELRFYTEDGPTPEELEQIQQYFLENGVELYGDIAYDSGIIIVRYIKTSPETDGVAFWPAIGIVAAGIAALGVVVFSWQMGHDIGSALSNPIVIVAGAAVLWFLLVKKPQMEMREQIEDMR